MTRNWNFVAHILRDVFPGVKNAVVNFGEDQEIVQILRTPEHSIEAWGVDGYNENVLSDNTNFWRFDINRTTFGPKFANLFMSFDYNPPMMYGGPPEVKDLVEELVVPGGFILLVNSGLWARDIPNYIPVRYDKIEEIKSFSLFKNDKVSVCQV